jgi:hypothetical protein
MSAAALALPILAAPAQAAEVGGRCRVVFFGSSTLHDFEGGAPCSRLEITGPGPDGTYRAQADVAVAELDTGIGARDEKMRAMFDAGHHPLITARFERIEPDALRARRSDALAFRIRIRDVERPVTPSIVEWSETTGRSARLRAEFELSLSDFGLEAPVAMGFMRVDDRVRVGVAVDLTERDAAASSAPQSASR